MRTSFVSGSKPSFVLMAAALLLWVNPGSADVVTDWNLIAVSATNSAGLNSNLASRVHAIEAIALYDAVNAIKHIGTPYHYAKPAPAPASAEAAAAQAAHDVLAHFFPSQVAGLDSNLAKSLAAIPQGPAKANGITVGSAAAADIIALRSDDGSSPDSSYLATGVTAVGIWRPTPPAFVPGVNVQWGSVKPFALNTADEFLMPVPPPLGSPTYKQASAQSKEIGSANSATRTEDQTHIVQFYKQGAELTINGAARLLATAHRTSLERNALVFALVDIAVADARMAVFNAKYKYKLWRPVTALNADPDGKVTNSYAAWKPLIDTPAHPEYGSGHSVTVSAGIAVLKKFYDDRNELTLHTATQGEPPRKVASLSLIEKENGLSRIYGGLHYSFTDKQSQILGHQVAECAIDRGPREATK